MGRKKRPDRLEAARLKERVKIEEARAAAAEAGEPEPTTAILAVNGPLHERAIAQLPLSEEKEWALDHPECEGAVYIYRKSKGSRYAWYGGFRRLALPAAA